MEVWIFIVSFATLFYLVLLKFASSSSTSGDKIKRRRLPPGPWTLPIIGSLHHVLRGLPHRTLRELSRRHGPLMFLRLGEIPTVVVSSAEVAELVMKTHDLVFADRPTNSVTIDIVGCRGNGIGFASYGDQWRQMKKMVVVELLSAKQVKRVESIRAEEVGRLLRTIADSAGAGVVNLSALVSTLGTDIVAMSMFGDTCAEKPEFVRAYDQVSERVGGFFPLDFFPSSRLVRRLSTVERRLLRSYGRIQSVIARIVESRKLAGNNGSDHEDMLDVMLRLQKVDDDSLAFPLTSETIGLIMFPSRSRSSGME